MIWYIVTDTIERYQQDQQSLQNKLKLEKQADDVCLLLHYTQLTPGIFNDTHPWAICHSGSATDYAEYDILQHPVYQQCVLEWDVAQIGFCGGHQLIAAHFGSALGPMRKLHPGEPDLNPAYQPGQYKEWGMYPIHIIRSDPLFTGLGMSLTVQEYHYWEVKELASCLVCLAGSENCSVQAFKHENRPVYGVQFHPEYATPAYPDGFKVLRNFFELAHRYMPG
jgi:GMP synthase-like glutamine amidotransferase